MFTHLSAAKTVVRERTPCPVLAGYPVHVLSPAVAAVRNKDQHPIWVETTMFSRLASQPAHGGGAEGAGALIRCGLGAGGTLVRFVHEEE